MSSPGSKDILIDEGTCYLVDMNPPRRSKPGKIRPVVVIQSSDTLRAGSPGAVIIPLTTKVCEENILRVRIQPSDGLKLQKPSDALLDQVHTIDRSLFIESLGALLPIDMEKIRHGIKFLLNFE